MIRIDFRNMQFEKAAVKEILYIGIPAGLQSALYSLANVVITATVNSFGADATTGISIANQFDGILYQISYAPSLATIPYIAQNMGAKNMKRVKQTVVRAVLITTAFGASFGACSAIFSGQLSSIMSSSAEVIKYSQQKMVIISSTYFICGINEVMGGVLKGMGKPILPTAATLIFMCLFRFVWVYGVFPSAFAKAVIEQNAVAAVGKARLYVITEEGNLRKVFARKVYHDVGVRTVAVTALFAVECKVRHVVF